jgi:hypothetical protein
MKFRPAQAEPGRAMPGSEIGKADGIIPILTKFSLDQLISFVRSTVKLFDYLEPGGRSAVGDHTIINAVAPGHPSASRGQAGGIRTIIMIEPHPFSRYAIYRR